MNGHNLTLPRGAIYATNSAILTLTDSKWTHPFVDNGEIKGIKSNYLALDHTLGAVVGGTVNIHNINITYYNASENQSSSSGHSAILQVAQGGTMIVDGAYIHGTTNIYYIDNNEANQLIFNDGIFEPDTIDSQYISNTSTVQTVGNDILVIQGSN